MVELLKTLLKLLLGRGVYTSFAQFGEDLIIRPFVPAHNGVYVDVGCYHPVLYSNTYRLYKRGWSGIVIDPNPRFKNLYKFLRPRDTFVLSGVGKESTEKDYYLFSDGAYNTFDSNLVDSYTKRTRLIRKMPVHIQSLSEICKGMTHIDVLSIDVEGLDLEVLESHDWRIRPTVIIVEASPNAPTSAFLHDKGYELVGQTKLNCIFRLKKSV